MKADDAHAPATIEDAVALALALRDEGAADWLDRATAGSEHFRSEVEAAVQHSLGLGDALRSASESDAKIGRVLAGRFRLVARAGSGSMGVVYRAEDLVLARTVAVKVIQSEFPHAQDVNHRFVREAEAVAAVRHPSVVRIHDRGINEEGEPYLVMEWIEGVTLAEVLHAAERGIPTSDEQRAKSADRDALHWIESELGLEALVERSYVRTVVCWVMQLAEGLAAVHASGIVHRDVKPSNVIIGRDGRATLIDFGLARLHGAAQITQHGSCIGTPIYMPPEALARGQAHTPASDTYSLGATLYHLLTLTPPYSGTPESVVAAIATRDPRPAADVRPGLSRDLRAILDKALMRRPGARYANIGQMALDLAAVLAHEEVSVRPVPRVQRVLRSVARSRTARGAALAFMLVGVLIGVRAYRAHRLEVRRTETLEILRHLPPNPTTVGLDNRTWRFDVDRAALEEQLTRLVELDVDPLRGLLLRSSLRLDHGDPAGAARDMAAVANRVGTAYAKRLASAYAALDAGAIGHMALDLADLPQPSSPSDLYLAGYHHLRAEEYEAGYALLADERTLDCPHARILRLAFTPLDRPTVKERQDAAWSVLLAVEAYEHELGTRTAASRHAFAGPAIVLGRFGDALEAAEESCALAPRAHTNRINAARASLELGAFERAYGHLDVAEELAPTYWRPFLIRCWALIDEGRFDAALAHIEAAQLAGPWAAYIKHTRRAEVETMRALAHRARGETNEETECVAKAARSIDLAREIGPIEDGDPTLKILAALREGSGETIPYRLLLHAAGTPTDVWRLRRAVEHLPDDLDADETRAVTAYLNSLVSAFLSSKWIEPSTGD